MTSVLGASEENKGWCKSSAAAPFATLSGLKEKLLHITDFAAFKEFLRQPFTAACALTGAVDLLMGRNGVLSEYLQRDSDHWNVRNFDLEREVKYIKGKPPQYRCRLGCILLTMAAILLLAGAISSCLPHSSRSCWLTG